MRIISGEFKGRRLAAPAGTEKTRPLPDRVRTALFNMLVGHFEGNAFFDAFAGTGSFGLEAISRGAARCVFVERDRDVFGVLKRNIEHVGAGARAEAFLGDALGAGALSKCPRPVHVVMFDPPYALIEDQATRPRAFQQFTRLAQLLDDTGFAILRTPWPLVDHVERAGAPGTFDKVPVSLRLEGVRGPESHVYGSTAVHWYMKETA
ncbi:MAG: RsmD family RNA methyltransferase [Planctomycetota bacterium]|nr:RsmD family RNA methyltransferase [Planctomycetota bacterium]